MVGSVHKGKKFIILLFALILILVISPQQKVTADDLLPKFKDYVFYSSWGGEGKQILRPEDVAIGPDGKIYVANSELNRITIVDQSGFIYNEIGGFGRDDGEFELPLGVAVNSIGEIYVSDTWNRRIQKFSEDGKHLISWGESGSEPGQFWGPVGIAFDNDLNVYVADSGNHRIQKFTSDGELINILGEFGDGDYQFNRPRDLAFNSSGELFVVDSENYRIQKYSQSGEYLSTMQIEDELDMGNLIKPYGIVIDQGDNIFVTGNNQVYCLSVDGNLMTSWGGRGSMIGEFNGAMDIDIDNLGRLYVADALNNRIQMFSYDGNFLNLIGVSEKTPGYFYYPAGISIINGDIYVTDSNNDRVQRFNQDGTFLSTWGSSGVEAGQFSNPNGISGDAFGNIYVVDQFNNRIQKFDSTNEFLSEFGEFGNGSGQFNAPQGIAIDKNGNIFIADTGNNRIQKFNLEGGFLFEWGSKGYEEGQFDNPRDIAVDSIGNVFVADTINSRVQKFTNDGEFVLEWNFIQNESIPYPAWVAGIAIDVNDDVYISGVWVPELQKYSNQGEFLGEYGELGNGPGEFAYGSKFAINTDGILFIVDGENQRVQVISPFKKDVDFNSSLILNGGFETVVYDQILNENDKENILLKKSEEINQDQIPEIPKWTYGGALPVSLSVNYEDGGNMLLLGEEVEQINQGLGDAWGYQVIHIPENWMIPQLTFNYNIYTNDVIDKSDFFVEIQDGVGLNHLETILRDGYSSDDDNTPPIATNLGWKSVSYDLAAFRGQTVRIIFSNRNLWPESKGIWTYLDDVKITDESEKIFLPLLKKEY